MKNLDLSISKGGSEFKSYHISKLPYKYWSFYNYARKVVDLLKSKIPKAKLKNVYGTFT